MLSLYPKVQHQKLSLNADAVGAASTLISKHSPTKTAKE